MKRFFMICLSVLVLAGSFPAVPVKAAEAAAIPYELSLEIYYTLITLLETGRLISGQDKSIYGDDFLINLDEFNKWLVNNQSSIKGIEYVTDSGAESLEDWVNKPWSKDGNVITGGLQYKLSVLRNDDNLNDFNQDQQNENNSHNWFDLSKYVIILSSAGVLANGILSNIKSFWDSYRAGQIPYSFNELYIPGSANYNFSFSRATDYLYQSGTINFNIPQTGHLVVTGVIDGETWYEYGYYDSNWRRQIDNGYTGFYAPGYYLSSGASANFQVNIIGLTQFSANVPIFNSVSDAYQYFRFGDLTKFPINYSWFNYDRLSQGFSASTLPLIDTRFTPYGFIGLQNGLSSRRRALNLGEDAEENTDLWLEDVPDAIGDILPDYLPAPEPDPDPIPEPLPEPIPEPIPDPEPDPAPEPEPDPEPDPDIDPVPDPDPDPNLEEIPIISGLQNRFPFSIPWDLKALYQNLSAEREAPSWTYNFYISPEWLPPRGFQYDFVIDLSGFEWLASLFRRLFLASFCIGLAIYSYGKFFGGGD